MINPKYIITAIKMLKEHPEINVVEYHNGLFIRKTKDGDFKLIIPKELTIKEEIEEMEFFKFGVRDNE